MPRRAPFHHITYWLRSRCKYHFRSERHSDHVFLHHSPISIESVVVESSTNNSTTQANEILNKQIIQDNSNKNIATIAAENLGIDMIKSGSNISTPVVHGLFGNRIQIINNGIPLSGQRWGT